MEASSELPVCIPAKETVASDHDAFNISGAYDSSSSSDESADYTACVSPKRPRFHDTESDRLHITSE